MRNKRSQTHGDRLQGSQPGRRKREARGLGPPPGKIVQPFSWAVIEGHLVAGWHDAREKSERLAGSCVRTRRGRHLRFQCTMESDKALEKHSRRRAWLHVMAGCRPRADVRPADARTSLSVCGPVSPQILVGNATLAACSRSCGRDAAKLKTQRAQLPWTRCHCISPAAGIAALPMLLVSRSADRSSARDVLGTLDATKTCAKSTA